MFKDPEKTAGFSVFLTMSYIMFVNPVILSRAGVPPSAVFLGTCLIAILGSYAVGQFANMPMALAPAMGINVFFATYISQTGLPWELGLIACAIAGGVFWFMSYRGIRRELVMTLPEPIKIAINSAIGAILADFAIKQFLRTGCKCEKLLCEFAIKGREFGFFLVGLTIIILFHVLLKKRAQEDKSEGLLAVSTFGFIISIGVLTFLAYLIPDTGAAAGSSPAALCPPEPARVVADRCFPWGPAELQNVLDAIAKPSAVILALCLGFFVLYVLLVDIVGGPFDTILFPATQPDYAARTDSAQSWGSFMTVVAPIFGTTPPVFYGENHVGKMVTDTATADTAVARQYTGTVAKTVAVCFLLAGVGTWVAAYVMGFKLTELVPSIAIAPTLLYVGLGVIANSFAADDSKKKEDERTRGMQELWIPGATAVTLVPFLSLEIALSIAIAAYYVITRPILPQVREGKLLHVLAVLAIAALLVRIAFAGH